MSTKSEHELFVSSKTGSSEWDVILTLFSIFPSTLISSLISGSSNLWRHILFDFIVCILPLMFSFTVLANQTFELNAFLLLASAIILIGIPSNCDAPTRIKPGEIKHHLSFITSIRAMVNISTAIAILAVDFQCFPRRFAKTEQYGYSLMDVGAAIFVLINGLVECRKRSHPGAVLRDGFILSVLGLARLFLVWGSNYQHPLIEYGMHGNFFFTLAFMKLMLGWWTYHLGFWLSFCLGVLVTCIHQLTLTWGQLGPWVFSEAPRDTFLAANREWIVSLPGYCALYIFGTMLGVWLLDSKHPSGKKFSPSLLILSISCGLMVSIVEVFIDAPSRRLCNLPFVIWILFFGLLVMFAFAAIDEFLLPSPSSHLLGYGNPPPIFRAVNGRPLLFFLMSNVATGLVNLSVNTMNVQSPWDCLILGAYSLILTVAIFALYQRDCDWHKENKCID